MCLHTYDSYDLIARTANLPHNFKPARIFTGDYNLIGAVPVNFRDHRAVIQGFADLMAWHKAERPRILPWVIEEHVIDLTGSYREAEVFTEKVVKFFDQSKIAQRFAGLKINREVDWEFMRKPQILQTIRDFGYENGRELRMAA